MPRPLPSRIYASDPCPRPARPRFHSRRRAGAARPRGRDDPRRSGTGHPVGRDRDRCGWARSTDGRSRQALHPCFQHQDLHDGGSDARRNARRFAGTRRRRRQGAPRRQGQGAGRDPRRARRCSPFGGGGLRDRLPVRPGRCRCRQNAPGPQRGGRRHRLSRSALEPGDELEQHPDALRHRDFGADGRRQRDHRERCARRGRRAADRIASRVLHSAEPRDDGGGRQGGDRIRPGSQRTRTAADGDHRGRCQA